MRAAYQVAFVLTLLLCAQRIWAQDGSLYAKIIDSNTGQPVPFATVKLMQGPVLIGGVVSNGDGDFQIPSRYRSGAGDLVITCIGYAALTLKVNQLLQDKVNIIKLKTTSLQLNEVVVTPRRQVKLTASKIVRLAIQNIPRNYPTHPYSYLAYYRDYQKEENAYVNLNEAIVAVLDEGFNTNDFVSTQLKLHEFRPNKNFARDSITAVAYDNNSLGGNKFIPTAKVSPLGGNELTQLRIHDAIRNNRVNSYSFVNEFSSDFVRNHSFKLVETVFLDDVALYRIAFQTFYFVTKAEHVARGEIFIEHGTYAIHKLIYSTYLKESGEEKLLYSIREEYARADSLMYLNYISFNNFFKANTHEGFQVMDLVYDRGLNAFVVTFNHVPQRVAALDKKNYHFTFAAKPCRISHIAMAEKDDKQVHVFIENADEFSLRESPVTLARKFEASFKNIKDLQGNEVNEIKYKRVNQFRELFLQKLDATLNQRQGPFIAKEAPLQQNPVDSLQLHGFHYWMNTPLRSSADWERVPLH